MGVALGQSRQSIGGFSPKARKGFTLVELVVVIGIIVLLLAIALPVLQQVRESARRSKCASNLREIGAIAYAFAADNNTRFPVCYRMRDTASASYPYYVPFCISQGAASGTPDLYSNDGDNNLWPVFGTSWVAWQRYGATLQIFSCPSALGNGAFAKDITPTNPEWGAIVFTDYMWVGGLSTTLMQLRPGQTANYTMQSTPHWGTAVPAVTTADGAAQQGGQTITGTGDSVFINVQNQTAVLAADMVFYSGGSAYQWSVAGVYRINHTKPGDNTLPIFQNVLYSDRSVRAHGPEDYTQPLNIDPVGSTGNGTPADTGPNWSMLMSNSSGIGGYLYWGEGKALPPPLPPTSAPTLPDSGSGWPTPPPLPVLPNPIPPPPPPPAVDAQTPVPIY